jgi:hypothetical protein
MDIPGICEHPLKRLRIDDFEAARKIGTHRNLLEGFRGFRNHEGWWRKKIVKSEDGSYDIDELWELECT